MESNRGVISCGSPTMVSHGADKYIIFNRLISFIIIIGTSFTKKHQQNLYDSISRRFIVSRSEYPLDFIN
jgi:hypothetical protein